MPATRPAPKIRAIECPNCGGAVELRGMGSSLRATCVQCLSLLDVTKPEIKIVQRFQEAMRREPKIPLGSRGKFDNVNYEAIGFQTRGIMADGTQYTWDEYVLYNPYHGFRYLTEYDGHWNFTTPVAEIPVPDSVMGAPAVRRGQEKFKLFQTANAETLFVMGEFPWRVKVGERVTTQDYVSPPLSLASETVEGDVNWSLSTYTPGQEIWQKFQLPGSPPPANGVYSNQPNPYGSSRGLFGMLAFFSLLLFITMTITGLLARNEVAFQSKYTFVPGSGEPSFVTPSFELKGGESNVEIDIETDLDNNWAFFSFALINEQTGTAYDFGKEVNYYYGRDSDGSWSEGDRRDSVGIGGVPGGRYYLRVEPEVEKSVANSVFGERRVNYSIRLRRDVAVFWPYFVAWPLLLLPPLFGFIRRAGFEGQRWAESDPTGAAAHSSSDEEDDD
jgi:hypothetical protein